MLWWFYLMHAQCNAIVSCFTCCSDLSVICWVVPPQNSTIAVWCDTTLGSHQNLFHVTLCVDPEHRKVRWEVCYPARALHILDLKQGVVQQELGRVMEIDFANNVFLHLKRKFSLKTIREEAERFVEGGCLKLLLSQVTYPFSQLSLLLCKHSRYDDRSRESVIEELKLLSGGRGVCVCVAQLQYLSCQWMIC